MPICSWFVGTQVTAFLTAEVEASQKDTNVKEIWAENISPNTKIWPRTQ